MVSSSDSRSSGDIKTAAGFPLRVMMIRSWVLCTESTRADNWDLTLVRDSLATIRIILKIRSWSRLRSTAGDDLAPNLGVWTAVV